MKKENELILSWSWSCTKPAIEDIHYYSETQLKQYVQQIFKRV